MQYGAHEDLVQLHRVAAGQLRLGAEHHAVQDDRHDHEVLERSARPEEGDEREIWPRVMENSVSSGRGLIRVDRRAAISDSSSTEY